MLHLIDKAAVAWMNWRVRRAATAHDPAAVTIKEFAFANGKADLLIQHDMLATLADGMSELLEAHNPENYITFELWGRSSLADGEKRPVLVTLQWAHRNSPAETAAILRRGCEEAVLAAEGGASASDVRYKAALALASCGYPVPRLPKGMVSSDER